MEARKDGFRAIEDTGSRTVNSRSYADHLMTGPKVVCRHANFEEIKLSKAKKKIAARKPYTTADVKVLKQHSKARTPVSKIARQMKRSVGSLRQKALKLGIGLGHQR